MEWVLQYVFSTNQDDEGYSCTSAADAACSQKVDACLRASEKGRLRNLIEDIYFIRPTLGRSVEYQSIYIIEYQIFNSVQFC